MCPWVLTDVLVHAILDWQDLAPLCLCLHEYWCFMHVCVRIGFTELQTVCPVCVCLWDIWDHCASSCEGKRQAAALTSAPGHWGRTLNQATERKREYVCVCVCFWGWDGLTGSCEKKYDCLSEVDCRCSWGGTTLPCRRCLISPQQSAMQVEQTRWPGKDLYNTGPCSRMIVLCICVYPVNTCGVARLVSSEDKYLWCSPQRLSACFLWRLT